jgi:nucleotide-binding universal stress UspA family protein
VEFVGRLLSAERDELVLLFVTPTFTFEDDRLDPIIEERARAALSRTVLEAATERLPAAWRDRVAKRDITGVASARLLEAIDEEHADLVALGFHGTSGIIAEFVLGSVCRTVVHSAKIPVLVVKSAPASDEMAKQSPGSVASHIRVLTAYSDGDGEFAARATAVLSQLTWPPEMVGWAITVVQPMFVSELPDWITIERDPDVAAMAAAWESEHRQNLQAARNNLAKYRAALPACFTNEELIVAEGRPAEELLAQVHEKSIDLVVMGSRVSGTLTRLLLGSTSSRVLREAPCSVLIVR